MTSLYTIIAKVPLFTFRECLGNNISKSQGAFVKGKQIMDVALIANDLVEDIIEWEGRRE